jgi:hypothetical protein
MTRNWWLLVCSLTVIPATSSGEDWPQWLGSQRDGVWREKDVLERFPPGGPKLLWRQHLGSGYSGPAVANGCVFVMDRRVEKDAAKPKNDFDRQTVIKGYERVVCLAASSGEVLWIYEYPCDYRISYQSGPRCTPTVDGDYVYCLGAMGICSACR